MPIFTVQVQNHLSLTLLNLTITPGIFLAFCVLAFAYLYIIYIRNNPIPRIPTKQPAEYSHGGDYRGARKSVQRTPLFRRLSTRLRTRKYRPEPTPPLRLPIASFWLPLRDRVGHSTLGFWRQIQSSGLETRGKRTSQQRLLE